MSALYPLVMLAVVVAQLARRVDYDAPGVSEFRALLMAFLRHDLDGMNRYGQHRSPMVDGALVVATGLALALGEAWDEDPHAILQRIALSRASESPT